MPLRLDAVAAIPVLGRLDHQYVGIKLWLGVRIEYGLG